MILISILISIKNPSYGTKDFNIRDFQSRECLDANGSFKSSFIKVITVSDNHSAFFNVVIDNLNTSDIFGFCNQSISGSVVNSSFS